MTVGNTYFHLDQPHRSVVRINGEENVMNGFGSPMGSLKHVATGVQLVAFFYVNEYFTIILMGKNSTLSFRTMLQ